MVMGEVNEVQVFSLSSIAIRGHPEYPSQPLVREDAIMMPWAHRHSVRVHVGVVIPGVCYGRCLMARVRGCSIGGDILGERMERSIIGVLLTSWSSRSMWYNWRLPIPPIYSSSPV